jgi:predicted RNA-binding protein with PIN domain
MVGAMSGWLVDGMNLIGSRPDGWWRDRPAARRRLVDELARFGQRSGDSMTVVFDGRPGSTEVTAAADVGVEAQFAPGGPNAADDAIFALVRTLAEPGAVTVVTSDTGLAARVQAVGGTVMGVSAFRRLMTAP